MHGPQSSGSTLLNFSSNHLRDGGSDINIVASQPEGHGLESSHRKSASLFGSRQVVTPYSKIKYVVPTIINEVKNEG